MGSIVLIIFVLSCLYSLYSGNTAAAGSAVLEGVEYAVSFALSIAGGLCLWSAVLELMEQSGLSALIARGLCPVLRRIFPCASRNGEILSALSENVSANLLGLGNAATPAGIRAAKGIAALGDRRAGDELCLLVVLNTASIQLLPSTIASVRASLGASSAFDIMPAVWISSVLSVCAGLCAAAFFRRIWK